MRSIINIIISLAASCLFTGSSRATEQGPSENLKWARAYLMNAIYALEYETVMDINITDGHLDPSFAIQDKAVSLWLKAKLSLLDAKSTGRLIAHSQKINETLKFHEEILKRANPKSLVIAAIVKSNITENFLRAQVQNQILPQFTRSWHDLAVTSDLAKPKCSLVPNIVEGLAARQKSLAAASVATDAFEVISVIKSWDQNKVECLLFAFMSADPDAQDHSGYDPLILARAIELSGEQIADQEVIRLVSVIRLLDQKLYAQSLKILLDLADSNNSYRLAIDTVQRIFSFREHGAGNVAIRGI